MSEEELESEDREQATKNKPKVKISKLAVVAVVCGVISLISFGILYIVTEAEWASYRVSQLLLITFVLSVLLSFLLGCVCLWATIFCKNGFKRYSLGLPGLAIVVLVGAYTGIQTRDFFRRWHCGLNMEAIGHSAIVYANEHNNIFPPPDRWCDLFIEEVDGTPKMFICPGSDAVWGESSYAMNINLRGKRTDDVPSDTVMFFETDLGKEPGPRNGLVALREFSKFLTLSDEAKNRKVYKNRWNQHGGPESAIVSNHVEKMCMVVFVDLTVDFIKPEDINNLRWEAKKVELQVGDDAPGFGLVDQDGETVSLSDFTGKKVLVYFYPKADTPGCTKQACSVRDSTEALKEAGVVPLGISPDEPNAQQKFSEKYGLGFRLLSDTDHKIAEAYGVWGEKSMLGKKYMGIIRSSFLIDEKGKLMGVWYNVKPENTVPNALAILE